MLKPVSIAFPFCFFCFTFPAASVCFLPILRGLLWGSCLRLSVRENFMLKRQRCPFCRRWFHPHPGLKQRQRTCGRPSCRREQRRRSNQRWRSQHPDYFQGVYPLQKPSYGTRADYKRRYRQQHPDYVRRNTAFVRNCRSRRELEPVSPTSCDLHLRVGSTSTSIRISHVSHTSRDIFVSLCSS